MLLKNISSIGIYIALALLVFSCESVLEKEPLNEVGEEFIVTDESSANAMVAGLYNELQHSNYYGDNYLIIGDVSADIAESVGTWDFYREMDTYEVSAAGNTENDNFYTQAYLAINAANNILEKIPALDNVSDDKKNPMLGAAYFIRGLALFDLTRLYGGVPGVVGTMGMPILEASTNAVNEVEYPTRPTLQASYDAIEQDLLTAVNLLPDSDDKSTASKGAAQALLSRLYLYLNRNQDVIDFATLVIDNPLYVLNEDFVETFSSKLTSEAVFELNFNSSDPSGIRNWYNPNGGRADLSTHDVFHAEAVANPNDIRGSLYGFSDNNGFYQIKYQKPGSIDNIQILRLAEIILNRAEGYAQLDQFDSALDDLDLIRERAGIGAISPRPNTKDEVLQAIWTERKLEFAFEGHRYFDLMRTGQIMEVLQNIERKNGPMVSLPEIGRAVFPIPVFELDANENLEQNEAYR